MQARHITRRQWVAVLSAYPLAAATEHPPEVSSFDLSLLDEGVTPAQLFFVRDHFAPPAVARESWTLRIEGPATAPFDLDYAELTALPRTAVPATLECAENPVGGGLVSHAKWEGVSLADLLRRAQPGKDAAYVRFTGSDGFSRTIPLGKALLPGSLVAYRMNDMPLPPAHGGPARVVVPGWYGVHSVKWVKSIEFLTAAPAAPDYRRVKRSLLAGLVAEEPVTAGLVKSAFSRPVAGALLEGRKFTIRGIAWAGENMVRLVEISTDGGQTWQPARYKLPARYCWGHWEYSWSIPGPGDYELAVRATDDQGNTQPLSRDSNRADSYEQNAVQRIGVSVR